MRNGVSVAPAWPGVSRMSEYVADPVGLGAMPSRGTVGAAMLIAWGATAAGAYIGYKKSKGKIWAAFGGGLLGNLLGGMLAGGILTMSAYEPGEVGEYIAVP